MWNGRKSYNHDIAGERVYAWGEYECRQLWADVMAQAIADLQADTERNRDDARAWFASGRMGVGSFVWICTLLGLDAEAVRDRMRCVKAPDTGPRDQERLSDGMRLRQWRIARGWTQKDLACILGYANNTMITDLEHGRYDVQRVFRKIKELGIDARAY